MKSKAFLSTIGAVFAVFSSFAVSPANSSIGRPIKKSLPTAAAASIPITFGAIPTQTYGGADFSPGATSTATITYTSSNTEVAVIVAGKIRIKSIGTSNITANNGSTTVVRKLTVVKAALAITVNAVAKTYGAANPALTVSYSGFVKSETSSVLTTKPVLTTTATASSPAGVYAIHVSTLAADSNYNISYVAGSLTVNKAPLAISANNVTKVYGAAVPALPVTYTGFVNGDSNLSLSAPPIVSTSALVSSPVGAYAINVSGATGANYTITFKPGKLTIGKAPLTIAAVAQTKVYSAALPVFSVTYTGFTNGDSQTSLTTQPIEACTATAHSATGNYPITVAGAADSNYTITFATAPLTITRAPLTVTANNQAKIAGAANPTLTFTIKGFVNGDTTSVLTTLPNATTTATTTSKPGSYPINVGGAIASNYSFTYVPGVLIITDNGILAPSISYSTPITVTEGTPFNLMPVNSGGAVPAQSTSVVTTLAGSPGVKGAKNGQGYSASFNFGTSSAAVDAFGNVYVADQINNVIRRINASGLVTTFAGSGAAGSANGVGTAASFNAPTGICVDLTGNIYVSDRGNNLIRKITSDGTVTTMAGDGSTGAVNGATAASSFNYPQGIAAAHSGNVFVLDTKNSQIRKITIAGVVSTVVSNPAIATATGIAIDPRDNTIVVSGSDNYIRRFNQINSMFALAGTGAAGSANGPLSSATFNNPGGLVIFPNGDIVVADAGNNKLRLISLANQTVSDFAGNGTKALTDAGFSTSSFNNPTGVATRDFNNFFITDAGNEVIRRAGNSGYSLALLNGTAVQGISIDANTGTVSGTPTAVSGNATYLVTAGNGGGVSVAPIFITILNSVSASSIPNIYTIAGNGIKAYAGDGGPATSASFGHPYALAFDKAGNLYVAAYDDNTIRKIDATTKKISTIAGTGVAGFSGDGGPAINATFNLNVTGMAIDAAGNIYIGDALNNRVRKIDATTKKVSTIAGTGVAGYSGDGGLATAAQLNTPGGILLDANNNIYIADEDNGAIRMIDATSKKISTVVSGLGYVERMVFDKTGNMYFGDEGKYTINKMDATTHALTVIGGNGTSGYNGDGGPATAAGFTGPMTVALDSAGNIYVSDQPSNVIRKIDATTQVISTFAGTGGVGYSGDGASASLSQMDFQSDMIMDKAGNLYVADLGNMVVRRIGGQPLAQTIAFSQIAPSVYGAPVNLTATASSGLPVSYVSSNPAVADFVNSLLVEYKTGSAIITASQPGNADYQAAPTVARNLTITAAPLTVTADNKTMVSGSSIPLLTVSYSGFVNGDDESAVTRLPTITTTATSASTAGAYKITATGATVPSYTITYVDGTLTVTAGGVAHVAGNTPASYVQEYAQPAALTTEPFVRQGLSPNGDGVNDVLVIDGISKYPQNKLTIINRGGAKVYELSGYDNVNKAFNGRSNITGSKQLPGTYFYVLEYKDNGAVKHKTGYIVLKF